MQTILLIFFKLDKVLAQNSNTLITEACERAMDAE